MANAVRASSDGDEFSIWAEGVLTRLGPHGGRVRLRDSITELGFAIRAVPFEDRERMREGCAVRFVMKDPSNIGRVVPAE